MSSQSIYKSSTGEKAVMDWYDSMIAHWPVPCETLNLPTRYGNAFVIASGRQSATPLVLLHGAGSNSAAWVGDIAEYQRQYRVYAIDLPGEPGKSDPNRLPWDSEAYAEWLEDVLDSLRIDKTILIGLSQGGWTAIKFAIRKPERVFKLILLTPGGIVPDKLSFVARALPLSLFGSYGIRQINRMILGEHNASEDVNRAMTLLMSHFKPRVGLLPIFTDSELKHLTMPVLLIMGECDALRDASKISARMQMLMPHLTTIIVPRGSHALMHTATRILPFIATRTNTC
jgi:pimeloyl-ACP methyl ester carboxylesterase